MRNTTRRGRTAIALHDSGKRHEATLAWKANHARSQRLRDLFHEFGKMARLDAERALAETEKNVGRLGHVLVGTSIAGAIASLLAGFLWARRITKPIYELEVQVQSATERTRIQVAPGRAGVEALGDQVKRWSRSSKRPTRISPNTGGGSCRARSYRLSASWPPSSRTRC